MGGNCGQAGGAGLCRELGELTIDYGIGVTIDVSYEIKRLDADYFEEKL